MLSFFSFPVSAVNFISHINLPRERPPRDKNACCKTVSAHKIPPLVPGVRNDEAFAITYNEEPYWPSGKEDSLGLYWPFLLLMTTRTEKKMVSNESHKHFNLYNYSWELMLFFFLEAHLSYIISFCRCAGLTRKFDRFSRSGSETLTPSETYPGGSSSRKWKNSGLGNRNLKSSVQSWTDWDRMQKGPNSKQGGKNK